MTETTTPALTPLGAAELAALSADATARVAAARARRDEAIRVGYTRRAGDLLRLGRAKPSTAAELANVEQARADLAQAEDELAVIERAAELVAEPKPEREARS